MQGNFFKALCVIALDVWRCTVVSSFSGGYSAFLFTAIVSYKQWIYVAIMTNVHSGRFNWQTRSRGSTDQPTCVLLISQHRVIKNLALLHCALINSKHIKI